MCGRGGGRRRRGYGPSGFEEAGGYMAAKISKLQNQYKDSVSTREGEEKKGLFHGVAIFVNGYTEPTAEELKRLMMVHGGTYHHYYSRSQTTHIIANNLPDTKIKNMNTERIVSPKWIINSIAAGHLLDYTKYILYGNQSRSQPRLQFKSALPPDKGTESLENLVNESSVKDEQKSETYKESKCISLTNDALGAHQGNTAASDNSEDTEAKIEGERDFKRHLVISANSPNSNIDNKHSPVKGHAMSTANPKFLSEFYNNSRLHHISTMGAMFKEYINELQNKGDGFPGREKLKEWITNRGFSKNGTTVNEGFQCSSPQGKNKRIIMHIDMDCFFVSVGLRKHPELRDKPVAVTHGRGNSQGHVREGMDRQYELNFYKQRAQKKLKAKMLATGSTIKDEDLTAGQQDGDEHKEQSTERLEKRFATIDLIDDTSSLSEIASCNYEARKAGVRNGMFLGPALKLCPHLKTIPYDFEGYKEVSYKLYDIVASFTHDIEAVSCDEMFVDLTELLQSCKVSPEDFTTYLRERVQEETGCPCSAGLGANMLVARMATRHAKPNGQHWADPEDLLLYMKDHKATELPGVGWSTGKRLEAEGLTTCGDLQKCSLGQLQSLLGPRTGHSLYNYCRGVDTRAVKSEHVRKSVSAEVNYGIRFTCQNDAHKFISELAAEVESRLAAIKMKGKCITLKLKVRAKDAPIETAKFMGHGVCDNIAKSVSLSMSTSSADIIERETLGLLKQIKNPPQDFRGVGIQVSRLEAACASKPPGTSIKSFLLGAKKKAPGMGTHAAGTLVADISVDASFLEAIPEELQKELKQDLEHLKQVREAAAPLPGNNGLQRSPLKQENMCSRGRGQHRGRRGRRGKVDSRRVEAEGLVTLTSMFLGNTDKHGNFTIKKNITSGKKRDRSPSSRETGPDCASPKKKSVPAQQREEQPKVSGDPEPAAHVTDELLPTSEQMKEKKVPIEVVPDLCGMKELSDVKSLIQAWVASCVHPENEDADILAGYFTSLITFHDLEKLDCLIKYLYRQILKTKNKLWESAYQVVISQVQLIMLEAHGTKLKVKMFENS
ncbi:DNA repair protein REV1-like isoform X3 [Scylla paramamosain]|uniref:DNA repair protein REV1-like isoform X3 n=1 Tax=Scylla paramamosain TaxID=85552 RepID=UPI0030835DF2